LQNGSDSMYLIAILKSFPPLANRIIPAKICDVDQIDLAPFYLGHKQYFTKANQAQGALIDCDGEYCLWL
jgi:hypothetical protein